MVLVVLVRNGNIKLLVRKPVVQKIRHDAIDRNFVVSWEEKLEKSTDFAFFVESGFIIITIIL